MRAPIEEMLTIAAPAPRSHARHDGLRAEEGGLEVDRQRAVEILFRDVVEASRLGAAGIVDQNVDRAEALFHASNHGLHGRANRDVGAEGSGFAAAVADGFGDGLSLLSAFAIVDGDRCSRLGQRQGNRLADAARAAGDQCYPPGQIWHDEFLRLTLSLLAGPPAGS